MRLTISLLILFVSNLGFGQSNICQNVYLWDFKSSKNERNFITTTLSNEVEDILSQLNKCKILQRRKYADIQKQVNNEIQISNVEGISYELKKKLKTAQAERVLFGEVEQDFSFNVNLRLRLEHLQTKQIKTSTILIKAEDMINPKLRTIAIKEGLKNLLGDNVDLGSNGGIVDKNKTKVINIEGHKIEVEECTKVGENLTCSLFITSLNKDRKISLKADNYQGETTVVDEFGNSYKSTGVKLGNKFGKGSLYGKDIFEGVRTPLEFTFNNFSSKANSIKVLKIALSTEELGHTSVTIRNLKIN
jgi:hypothetical protein